MALTSGLGVGGGSAISRRIGARDKEGVDNVALHTFVIMLILTAALTALGIAFVRELIIYSGAGKTAELGVEYARVIFGGSFIFFFTNVANSILRSEGDSKRAMQAMILGSGLNVILDPIFIYSGAWGCRSRSGNRDRFFQFWIADVLLVFYQKRYLRFFQVQFLRI